MQRRAYMYRPDGVLTAIVDQATGPHEFDLDRAGRVTVVRGNDWVERYAYGAAGQLVHAEWPGGEDAVGDRKYAGTLIQRAGGIRYQHDAQGRVVVKQRKRLSAKPDTWHYEWDTDDRLVGVRTPDGQQWRYHYDPFGRRIAKQRLDGATIVEQVDFIWDGPVLAEQTAQSRTTAWNFRVGTHEPITQTDRDGEQDWVDAQFYAIVTDMIGTPTELVTPSGTVAWQARTTLWGNRSLERGSAYTPLRFPGQYHDPESGLNYNYVRYYDPVEGRYASADPLGLDPAPDPHAYVTNPTGWVDPLGLAGIKWKCAENSENVSREKKPNPKNKLTNSQQRDMATFMGLKPAKGTVRSNPVFTDGKYYYVWDHDGHRGAGFKAATSIEDLGSKQSRTATVGIGRTKGTKGPWFLYRAGD